MYLYLTANIDFHKQGDSQSDFDYAMLTTVIAMLSMDEKDSEQVVTNVLVPPNTVLHLEKRLGTTRKYTDQAGNQYQLKITREEYDFLGISREIKDGVFALTITTKNGLKRNLESHSSAPNQSKPNPQEHQWMIIVMKKSMYLLQMIKIKFS